MYQTVALARRLSLSLILVFLKTSPTLQVALMIYSTLGYMIYIVSVRPFNLRALNMLELFNEAVILACLYHMLIFTEALSDDKEMLYSVGWSIDIVLVIHFVLNTCIIGFQFA